MTPPLNDGCINNRRPAPPPLSNPITPTFIRNFTLRSYLQTYLTDAKARKFGGVDLQGLAYALHPQAAPRHRTFAPALIAVRAFLVFELFCPCAGWSNSGAKTTRINVCSLCSVLIQAWRTVGIHAQPLRRVRRFGGSITNVLEVLGPNWRELKLRVGRCDHQCIARAVLTDRFELSVWILVAVYPYHGQTGQRVERGMG